MSKDSKNPLQGKTMTVRIRRPEKGTNHFRIWVSPDWLEWNHPLVDGMVEILCYQTERGPVFRKAISSLRKSGITVDVR